MAGLTISRFAAAAGVGVETVRFYQRRGLLAVPERQGPGYREYSEADQRRLAFICRARELGFTLSEIGDLLGPAETGFTGDILQAARAKLDQTHKQLTELAQLKMQDMNTTNLDSAMRSMAGTARSMGIEIGD